MKLGLKDGSLDCGCDTREETIGGDNWWNLVIGGSAVVILALAYGGNVTTQTKSVLKVAAAGAIVAVFANKIVKAP